MVITELSMENINTIFLKLQKDIEALKKEIENLKAPQSQTEEEGNGLQQ